MKRWIAFAGIILLGSVAVIVAERRKVDVTPSPDAFLYLVGDTERELTRMPVRFNRMSDVQEVGLGDSLAADLTLAREARSRPEFIEIERYLNQVGGNLARHARRKLPYKFHYFPGRYFVNAFALPGGHVYVGGGLMALMDSEDELAAVMAHEIEHIDHYHCADRAQQQIALRKSPFGMLTSLPIAVFEAGYSKEEELEADREGTRMAVASGYSANGAIRLFNTMDRQYREYELHPRSPEAEAVAVAQETIEGYFRTHPPTAERIRQIQNMIATEHWPLKPEQDLQVQYIFRAEDAAQQYRLHRYEQAEQIAQRSIQAHPGNAGAMLTVARAQFAQAHFAAAAATYRESLKLDVPKLETAREYSRALAANDSRTAFTEFQGWLQGSWERSNDSLKVIAAGLALLAGNSSPAKAIAPFEATTTELSGDDIGELGWWYYRAGDYATAATFLDNAVQREPGNSDRSTERTFVLIQKLRFADALQSSASPYVSEPSPARVMAEAIAFRLAKQPAEAMSKFEKAVSRQPEWKNSAWVSAQYSALVADVVEQLKAEQERLRNQRLAGSAQPLHQ